LTNEQLDLFAGRANNEQYGPSFMGNAVIFQGMYLDFEQVVAARSRVWGPSAAPLNYESKGAPPSLNPAVRQQFDPLMHDNIWGSGEPIASLDLHHVRLFISNIDTAADEEIDINFTFCSMPPSNQPMRVEIVKPDFLSKMTMVRRSLDV
jgi:hypothetical protein